MRSNLLALVVVSAGVIATPAAAEADNFGLGTGRNGALTAAVGAGSAIFSSCAPVTGLDGGSQLLFASGSIQTGQFGFTDGGLVLISRSTGLSFTPDSGDQNTLDLNGNLVGTYELARVASVTNGALTLTAPLVNTVAFASNTQVVPVPEFTTVTMGNNSSFTAPGWNGQCGGITALLASGAITLNGNSSINANGNGFRGGVLVNAPGQSGCTQFDGTSGNDTENASKGEGLVPARYSATAIGRGNVSTGGGGGNCHNAGGGGGSHGGRGGVGGHSWDGDRDVGGLGGAPITYSMLSQLLFGGGGGAGHENNSVGSGGSAGGGIVMLRASALSGSGFIRSNGAAGAAAPGNDGAGGGGAGGAVSVRITGNAACGGIEAVGGNGGNSGSGSHGPGGGGSGGRILFQAGSTTGGCTLSVLSGVGGLENSGSGGATNYGAGPSSSGDATTLGNVVTVPGPLTPPLVAFTAPANGTQVNSNPPAFSGSGTLGASITVRINGASVCTATVAALGTWSCTPAATLAQGATTATATALFQGLLSTPASSAFTIDTIAPVVALTAPSSNAQLATTTPTFSGTSEAGAAIRLLVDGNEVCATTANGAGTWSCVSSALTQGSHNASAVATDAAGNSAQTTPLRPFTVDTIAPAKPTISSPTQNQVVGRLTPTLSGTAEANSVVKASVDGNQVCTATTDGVGAWSCTSSSLSEGGHDATAIATDSAGNDSPVADVRHFFVDVTAPLPPTLTAPVAGSSSNNRSPTFSGSAEAGSTVSITVDGQGVCSTVATAGGTFACTPTAPLSEGTHSALATAADAAGNATQSTPSVSFTIDVSAPLAPLLNTPVAGSVSSSTSPTFSGTAEANSTVTVRVDGVITCTAVATGGTFSCTAPGALAEGHHVAQATAVDAAANVSPGSNVNDFRIDITAPFAPSILVPSAGATTGPAPILSGLSEPSSTVTVRVDGTIVCTAIANAQGGWAWMIPPLRLATLLTNALIACPFSPVASIRPEFTRLTLFAVTPRCVADIFPEFAARLTAPLLPLIALLSAPVARISPLLLTLTMPFPERASPFASVVRT